jgi:hypothetical protein
MTTGKTLTLFATVALGLSISGCEQKTLDILSPPGRQSMPIPGGVEVRVVQADNTPVAGASVRVGGEERATASDGIAYFPGLNPGQYTATLGQVPGMNCSPTSATVQVSAGQTARTTFTCTPQTGTISGTVTVNGTPQSGVTVRLGAREAVTGSGGAYTFTAVSVGPHSVQVVPPANTTCADNPRTVTVSTGPAATANFACTTLPSTGTLNVQVGGLPGGTNGNVRVTGPNGFDQVVTATTTLQVGPGTYMATPMDVVTETADYGSPGGVRTTGVSIGQVATLQVTYQLLRRLVQFNVAGLPTGVDPLIVLTSGSQQIQVVAAVVAHKLAVGTWQAEVRDVSASGGRTFASTLADVQTLQVAALAGVQIAAYSYYLARLQILLLASIGVQTDPFGHAVFIGLWASNVVTLVRQFARPAQGGAAANGTTGETVTISGPAPFVTVTGPRAADGAITLTGSATVAGWPNTPVVLTGTLSGANVLSGTYRMGQDTAPTGLPGGAITYTISGAPQP